MNQLYWNGYSPANTETLPPFSTAVNIDRCSSGQHMKTLPTLAPQQNGCSPPTPTYNYVPLSQQSLTQQSSQLLPSSISPVSANDRRFKCDQCPRSFKRNHEFKRHKRTHLAVKLFPCRHCKKGFTREYTLKVCWNS
jgi:uncharacterized Zn-finger protein